MPSREETIIENMKNHLEYLYVIRIRHQTWADTTNNPELARFHLEIDGLIKKTIDRYVVLLSEYDHLTE